MIVLYNVQRTSPDHGWNLGLGPILNFGLQFISFRFSPDHSRCALVSDCLYG